MKFTIKATAVIVLLSALAWACSSNNGSSNATSLSTWISGENTRNKAGTYGVQGTAASANFPGARSGAVSWIDSAGRLWLFGGNGYDSAGNFGFLNDLWRYDPSTSQWTWFSGSDAIDQEGTYGSQGTAAPSNVPGARSGAVSWIDSAGKLWLFGGTGVDSGASFGRLNDLWMFDQAALEWTWVSGNNISGQNGIYGTQGAPALSNVPGARSGAVAWIDGSGALWLFGGLGTDAVAHNNGLLNDLWKFDPATLEWTWVSGSDAINQAGLYGTLGTAAPANVAGARSGAVAWIDPNGILWLFGGLGLGSVADNNGRLNDLWRFDPAALEWTWVSGGDTVNAPGTYGTQGVAAATNVPGARSEAAAWVDSSGTLWFFGGYGKDSAGSVGYLNDLWRFDRNAQTWTWDSGGNTINKTGAYGTKGTASSANIPGSRAGAISWIDSSGKLWLFGGDGLDSAGNSGYLNDLWQFTR